VALSSSGSTVPSTRKAVSWNLVAGVLGRVETALSSSLSSLAALTLMGKAGLQSLVAGERRGVMSLSLPSLSSLLLSLPALLTWGRAVWNAFVVVQQWRW